MNAIAIRLNGSLQGEPFDIPGGTAKVEMTVLRYERDTRARVLLVRFPHGWARTQSGSYEAAEELIVIEGTLEMSGLTIRAGDHGYFPAGWFRHDMRAPTEVLAFARFAGPARWTQADGGGTDHALTPLAPKAAVEASPLGVGVSTPLHEGDEQDPSASFLIEDVRATTAVRGCELLDLRTWEWRWIEEGAIIPETERGFLRIP